MTKSMKALTVCGIVLLVVGLIGWILQLTGGLLANSGMTNIFLWGLMIVVFAFLVGFGAGSQLVASAIFLWGKDELKPIGRIAAICGFACVAGAGVAILADLGAIRNIMHMIFGLNFKSPLAWDMIAMSAFIVLSIIELVAIARDMSSLKVWAALAGVAAVALQIIEGLLFSMQASHVWWATPIMPIDFLVVAFVSGSALMLIIGCASAQPKGAIAWIARLCAIAIAIHLALALCDLGMVALENTPESAGVLSAIGSYIVLYLCELVLPAIAMVLLFSVGRDGSAKPCLWAGILAVIGIFCHRLMLLYPAYDAPSLYLTLSGTDSVTGAYPISTGRYLDWDQTFALTTPYLPGGSEILAALLPIGVAIVVAVVLVGVMRRSAPRGRHA